MTANKIYVNIEAPYHRRLTQKWLRAATESVLASEGVERSAELSLTVTGDKTVRRLNREYRGIDKTTDVLSFALTENVANTTFVTPSDGVLRLGEVIVSYPTAQAQAKEHNHPVKRELAWLLIHGILHLLGYDHRDDATEAKMRQREEAILKEIDL
jgi:probable rRNA maturation factor